MTDVCNATMSSMVAPAAAAGPVPSASTSSGQPLPLSGHIVVLKKTGKDGPRFPIRSTVTVIGRNLSCDIRIQLPHVSKQHAQLLMNESGVAMIENLSSSGQTILVNKPVSQRQVIKSGEVFTIGDRGFRYETLSFQEEQEEEARLKVLSAVARPPASASKVAATPLKAISNNTAKLQPTPKIAAKLLTPSSSRRPVTAPNQTPVVAPAPVVLVEKIEAPVAAPAAEPIPAADIAPEVPSMIASVEEMEQLNSPVPSVNAAAHMPTPLKHSITSLNAAASLKPKLAGLAKLATPMKQGIAVGRGLLKKVVQSEVEVAEEVAVENAATVAEVAAPRVLPTPVRKGIQARRRQSNQVVDATAEPVIDEAPVEAPVSASKATRRSSRTSVTPVEVPVPSAAAAPLPKLATPIRKGIAEGRSRLRNASKVVETVMEEEATELPNPSFDSMDIDTEEAAVEPFMQTESTVHISSHLSSEMETEIPATVEPEPEVFREQTIALERMTEVETQSMNAKRRALPTPLKAAIKKVQPVAKPEMKAMPTPLKKGIKFGREQLKPYFEPIFVEESVAAVPAAAGMLKATTNEAEAESVKGRKSLRVAADSSMTSIATVALTSPVRASIATAAAEVAKAKESKQAKKVLPTPLKKGIKNKEAVALKHVETTVKQWNGEEELVEPEVQPVEPAAPRALPTPIRKGIQSRRRRSSVAPIAERVEEVEVEMEVDVEPEVEAELETEQEEEVADIPVKRSLPTPVRAGIQARRRQSVLKMVHEEEVSFSIDEAVEEDAAITEEEFLPLPASRRSSRLSTSSQVQEVPAAEATRFNKLATPIRNEISDARSKLRRVSKVSAKKIVEEVAEDAASFEIPVAEGEAPVDAPDFAEETVEEEEKEEEEQPVEEEAPVVTRRGLPTPMKRGIASKAEVVSQSIHSKKAINTLPTPLKTAIKNAPKVEKVQMKSMPTPLKAAIKNAPKVEKVEMKSMPTPMKKALKAGRAQLKAAPIAAAAIEPSIEAVKTPVVVEADAEVEASVEVAMESEASEEEEEIATAPAVFKKAISLMPSVSLKLQNRRAGAIQKRVTKNISSNRGTAKNRAAHLQRKREARALKRARAAVAPNVIRAAEAGNKVEEALENLMHEEVSAPALDGETRALIQPIYEALRGLRLGAQDAFAPVGSPVSSDSPRVARGCHSTVATPATPATPANRRDSIDSIFARRRSSGMGFHAALVPATPITPSTSSAARSLVSNLVQLMTTPREKLPKKHRDSIDAIFEGLLDLELSLDVGTPEEMEAEQNRVPVPQTPTQAILGRLITPVKAAESAKKSLTSAIATPVASTPVTVAAPSSLPRRLATPLRAAIVETAQGFVKHVQSHLMATPLRKAIVSKQRTLAQSKPAPPVKVLPTPLKKSIMKGAELKPVSVASAPIVEEEVEVEAAPVVLSVFDGLEALEEAMQAAREIAEESKSAEIAPVSFSLQEEPAAATAPSPVRAPTRRASRQSFHIPLAIPEGNEPAVVVEEEKAVVSAEAETVAATVELLENAIMLGVESMVVAQVEVEQAVAQALQEVDSEITAAEPIATEAPIKQNDEAALEQKPKKGSKRARAAAKKNAVTTNVEIEIPVEESDNKKQKVEEAVPVVAAAAVTEAAPVKESKRRKTKAVAPSSVEEEKVVILTPVEESFVAPVVEDAPVKGRRRTVAPKRKAEEAEPEVVVVAAEPMVEDAPAPVVEKAVRGRKKKAVEEVAVAEVPSIAEIPSVVEDAAPAKRTGRGRKAAAASVETEVVIEAPVEPVAPAKGRKRKVEAEISPVVEPVAIAAPEVEIEAPSKKSRKGTTKKAHVEEAKEEEVKEAEPVKKASRGRKAAVVEEVDAMEVEEEVPTKKATRGRKAVADESPASAPVEVVEKKASRSTRAKKEAEPEPAAAEVVEEPRATRATRGRK